MHVYPRFTGTFVLKGTELQDSQADPLVRFLHENRRLDVDVTIQNALLLHGRDAEEDAFISQGLQGLGVPYHYSAIKTTLRSGFTTADVVQNICNKLTLPLVASAGARLNLVEKLALAMGTKRHPDLNLSLPQRMGVRLQELAEEAYVNQQYTQARQLFSIALNLFGDVNIDVYRGTPRDIPRESIPLGEMRAYLGFLSHYHGNGTAEDRQQAIRYYQEADYILVKALPELSETREMGGTPVEELTDEGASIYLLQADVLHNLADLKTQAGDVVSAKTDYQEAIALYRWIHGAESPGVQALEKQFRDFKSQHRLN